MQNAAAQNWVLNVDEATFQEDVIERSKETPVLIDFWAPWCGPCRQLSPLLEKVAAARGGAVVVAKINTDENPELAQYFQVEGIPAVFAIKDAQVVDQFTGLLPEAELNKWLDPIAPSKGDSDPLKQAEALEASNPKSAIKLYRELMKQEMYADPATLGLGRVLVATKAYAEALDVLKPLGDSGEFGSAAERLRKQIAMLEKTPDPAEVAAARKKVAAEPENAKLRLQLGTLLAKSAKYKEALDELLVAAENDRELGKGEVKALMVDIFHIVGVRSEMADEYRARLQGLLY